MRVRQPHTASRRTSERSAASTTTTTYTWDAMGHLARYASPEASATYSYGATGMRELKVVARGSVNTTTSVLWAGNKPVVERDGDGTLLRYLYGPGGLPLSLQVTRAGATNTYHYLTDPLGSVAALVSETGTVAATYAYDPWGRVTATGGADTWLAARQPLRYRAYYQDSESGLYYLPARYYDPKTYRFLTADPDPGSTDNPLSLNKYAYVHNNPIAYDDPSGAIHPDHDPYGTGYYTDAPVDMADDRARAKKKKDQNNLTTGSCARCSPPPTLTLAPAPGSPQIRQGSSGFYISEAYSLSAVTVSKIHNIVNTPGGGTEEVDSHWVLGLGLSASPGLSIAYTRGTGHVIPNSTGYSEAKLAFVGAVVYGTSPNRADPIAGNPQDPYWEYGVGSPEASLSWSWVFD